MSDNIPCFPECILGKEYPVAQCPNMKALEGDTDMKYEHYICEVCGLTSKLDYEELK